MNDLKIAIDDGHGLKTPGKRTPDGYKENEFNHYTKEYLVEELKNNDYKVIDCSPTRDDNNLANRCNIANDNNADIFVSIHFNAMGSKWQTSASGIETYYHHGSTKGKKLARCIQDQLIKGTKQIDRGIKDDYILYSSGLYVLHHTKMPAILCECGFMDNPSEAVLMKSPAFRKECGSEICKGICNYFGRPYRENKEPSKKVKYFVQTGAFSEYKNAAAMVQTLKEKNINAIIKQS